MPIFMENVYFKLILISFLRLEFILVFSLNIKNFELRHVPTYY